MCRADDFYAQRLKTKVTAKITTAKARMIKPRGLLSSLSLEAYAAPIIPAAMGMSSPRTLGIDLLGCPLVLTCMTSVSGSRNQPAMTVMVKGRRRRKGQKRFLFIIGYLHM